ncbi:MAG: lecithin retinol acyltransferase family protein [Pseudomonadota bacterium]
MNYAKYCGPRRLVHALASSETPPPGAHLITPWLGYTHHGIYVGDGRVVQYGALKYDIIRKPVEEVTLESFAQGRAIFVVRHAEACFDAEKVVNRARSRLGEKRYRLLTNNCEHFVEWCLHDEHRSFEVETALNFPRWFGERVLASLLRLVSREFRTSALARGRGGRTQR